MTTEKQGVQGAGAGSLGQPRGTCWVRAAFQNRALGALSVDLTAEAFPQMRSCRAGLREHEVSVKSETLSTLKIRKCEEELSNSNGKRGKGTETKEN